MVMFASAPKAMEGLHAGNAGAPSFLPADGFPRAKDE